MTNAFRSKDAAQQRRGVLNRPWKEGLCLTAAWLILSLGSSWAADQLPIEEMRLPPLHMAGQPARAHTQGLEVVADRFYVTARREDGLPRRALLLRTELDRSDWDVWDITPSDASGQPSNLDHPGGMQSDGARLWIPMTEKVEGTWATVLGALAIVMPVLAVAALSLAASFDLRRWCIPTMRHCAGSASPRTTIAGNPAD